VAGRSRVNDDPIIVHFGVGRFDQPQHLGQRHKLIGARRDGVEDLPKLGEAQLLAKLAQKG